jgi:hypothetical protein
MIEDIFIFGAASFFCFVERLPFFIIAVAKPVANIFHTAVAPHAHFVFIQGADINTGTFYGVFIFEHMIIAITVVFPYGRAKV